MGIFRVHHRFDAFILRFGDGTLLGRSCLSWFKTGFNELVPSDDGSLLAVPISGATGDDLDALRDKAREMGAKTKFSASEAASAMEYMSMAGWKTEDMLGGIEDIGKTVSAGTWEIPELELRLGANTVSVTSEGVTTFVYREGRL